MIRECLSNTTAHGIPHLVDEKDNRSSKFIWTLILLVSCAIFFYHSATLIEKYVKHETAVSVNFDGVDFIIPDIYICNENPFSIFLIDGHFKENNQEFINMSAQIKNDDTLEIYRNRQVMGYSRDYLLNWTSNRNFTDVIGKIESQGSAYEGWDVFDRVFNSYHGFCYKLKNEHKTALFMNEGLKLTLYTDIYSFVSWPFSYDGDYHYAKLRSDLDFSHSVYFVNPGDYPHREMERVSLEPGKKTTIEVTMEFHHKLNKQEVPCETETKTVTYLFDWLDANSPKFTYNANAYDCAVQMLHEKFLQICNCSWSMYPLDMKLWQAKSSTIKFCWNHPTCMKSVTEQVRDFYPRCYHRNPCKMPQYFTRITKAALTGLSLINPTRIVFGTKYFSEKNVLPIAYYIEPQYPEDSIPTNISRSFVMLQIYAPQRLSRLWKESYIYEMNDLLSDIGGILGFYVGISVVTAFEIFAYLARLFSIRMRVDERSSFEHRESIQTTEAASKL